MVPDSLPVGLAIAAAGVYLIGKCGSRRAAIRRLAACYGRTRFSTEPTTYVVAPSGLRAASDVFEASWAWPCVAEVRDHEGGLLLVFDGRLQIIDLPPSAFAAVDQATVARHIAEWIAAAGAGRARTPA